MRIVDTNQPGNTIPLQSGRTGATRPVPAGESNGSSGKVSQNSDSIELSGLSGRVSQTLQADSASRAEKVNQIAAAVQSGTYQVDAKAVSKAIVDHALSGRDADGDGDGR
jgi:flagellar biosynthesis anti-sigma factor FlgM